MPSVPRSDYGLCMSYAPLASFAGLSLGDYGLWKWSLAGNHQILAVVFGLTLPPLALAFAWMLVIASIRLFGALTRRPPRAAPPRARHPTGRWWFGWAGAWPGCDGNLGSGRGSSGCARA